MNPVAGAIRTPDQRLRVFVSSTLKELAPERRAARAAIERLALAPVMFELGARPHPPRSLYRAYLEQSDIFVGVYWEEYGWVAPGEEVSGLEDEWSLAPDIPKLIYIKHSEHRQERLHELLERIRDDDDASYVAFTDVDELAALVTADLATLLAERFDAAAGRRDARRRTRRRGLLDRAGAAAVAAHEARRAASAELATVTGCSPTRAQRLVTITGPGRHRQEPPRGRRGPRRWSRRIPDGVVFVDLAPVLDAGLVIAAVANCARHPGHWATGRSPRSSPGRSAGRRVLLVLDNVEQVVDAAPELERAARRRRRRRCSRTSRILLRVRGEQNVPLGPLPSPGGRSELFAERARAVKPDFELTADNAAQVAAICEALDNVAARPRARRRPAARADAARRWSNASTTRCPCSSAVPATSPNASARCAPPSTGAPSCCRSPSGSCSSASASSAPGFALDAVEWMADGLQRRRTPSRRSAPSSTAASCASRIADRGPGSACSPRCASTAATGSTSADCSPRRRSGTRTSTSGSPPRPIPPRPGRDRSSA